MKTMYYLLAICASIILSCKKTNIEEEQPVPQDKPATETPSELKNGLWFWGGLGPISYYDRDGHQLGSDWEAAREYYFTEQNKKGKLEFYQYLGTRSASNCVTEIFTKKIGTTVFEGNKFTFYPISGTFTTVKKGCSTNGTTTRNAEPKDLQADTWLWKIKDFEEVKRLYIYETKDTEMEDPVFVYKFVGL